MLKISIDKGGDYLEYLRPYVLQVITHSPPEVITDGSTTERLRDTFGLEIPRRTVHIVLKRLAKDGCLKKTDGVFTIEKELKNTDLSAAKADAVRHISAIIKALIEFAEKASNRQITEKQATDCLISFLSHFSIPCLKYYLRGTALPHISSNGDWQINLVCQFINDLALKTGLLESFMKLVQGHMLANALLCPDLHSVADSYKDVTFYFDTPLLIQLLGLDGEKEEQAIREVVQLVQHLRGKIAYFSHTFDELVVAIRSSAEYIDSQKGRSAMVDEARRSGRTKSDLLLIAQNASNYLADVGISAYATPRYDEKTHQFEISEEVFGAVLADEVNYHNPRAKDYDMKSVRSIYILRQGSIPLSLEKSRAIFVTNNSGFSKAAYDYGKIYEQSREVSTVITDFSLANIAWLKAPQGAPSLPQKEVFAFAYAAARPSFQFWSKVLEEADKLERNGRITARDHQLLRSSHHAQNELMKLTLGEETALTEESVKMTLKRVSEEIRKEQQIQLEQSESSRIETEKRLKEKHAQLDEIKRNIYWRCDRTAEREARLLAILIWEIQIAIAVAGVQAILQESIAGWAITAVAVLSGLVRLASTRWDIKPVAVKFSYKEWRTSKLLNRERAALQIKD